MRSIKSLQGLKTPSIETKDGLIPDFNSRYFTADFPYGLEILVQIGKIAGVSTPNLQETLDWYWNIAGSVKKFLYTDFGITNKTHFTKFYNK